MEKLFMKGNEAIAEAAVRAGCRFFAGYPITPQNEIPEYLSRRLPEVGGAFVQAESEISAINMVYGSAATGTLAMTSSSGPGISLKSEGISSLAGAQLPAVIVNVMRDGPGTGAIQAAQADYLQATRASGHGGFRMIVFAPASVQEAVDLTVKAFECAARDSNPSLVLLDGCIGAMMEPVILPPLKKTERLRYAGAGAKCLNPSGKDVMVVTSTLVRPDFQEVLNKQAAEMYDRWGREDVMAEEYQMEDAEYVVAAYGTSARTAKTAIRELRNEGVRVGLIRPITLYPFPSGAFARLDPHKVKFIMNTEMSIPAQMIDDVRLAVSNRIRVETCCCSGGIMMTNEDVSEALKNLLSQCKEGVE
ncbi:MAG: 3-methyl-2-oxobutanoate dehydrogenase subunit VorB [Synergistaceae bacterium]|jgi:2-oxoglutarate ferredoxin oxidoreductase subunit alpha|nr:3-methyl-2-oxobutanoate dehydrogenase subunit VorB [Synergistaceae bacterium]